MKQEESLFQRLCDGLEYIQDCVLFYCWYPVKAQFKTLVYGTYFDSQKANQVIRSEALKHYHSTMDKISEAVSCDKETQMIFRLETANVLDEDENAKGIISQVCDFMENACYFEYLGVKRIANKYLEAAALFQHELIKYSFYETMQRCKNRGVMENSTVQLREVEESYCRPTAKETCLED